MRRVLTGIASAAVFVALVQAQAAMTGKWQGETKNGNQIVLDVKATKTVLTGTLVFNGQPATIAECKVSKNTLTFKATVDGQLEGFAGEFAEDQITFWPERRGPSGAIVLKRVKTKG